MAFDGVLKYVVITGNVGGNYGGGAAAGGYRHRARRVEAVADVAQLSDDALAEVVPLNAPLFVADAPKNHRGVVAVAVDHRLQLTDVVVIDAEQAVFFDDEDAERVASVKDFGSHRVVARSIGVDAVFFEFFETVDVERVGDSRADSGVVLVHIYAFEFDGFTVEQEAGVGVEGDAAEAGDDGFAVSGSAVVERKVNRIEHGVVDVPFDDGVGHQTNRPLGLAPGCGQRGYRAVGDGDN